ncbi:MATE family efflux transporter [Fulvivirga sediminis]|uniref:Multidrug-efflux transporter n=1 Tax=Fulvivirga sediminis TaxID=2803949 RepID=A0A937JYK5_9BACT|nr:MATE family efflux transporter [Fulvivirga sediminis]MBL3656513.1 MATE family efflux transporter [Fulvivirga sediminis]
MKKKLFIGHFKKNLALALPVMISQLGHMMVNVADSMMVGQLGALPLAGASLANVVFNLILMFGIGVSYAITPLVAAADGEKNTSKSSEYLKHAFLINLITGFILFSLVKIGGNVLHHMNQPEDVVDISLPYLNIITLSMVPLMIFQTFRQFAEGLSHTTQAMIIVIGSNLINVGLNYLFIYGYEPLHIPMMGLNGAGWSSLISRIILALWMALYIYRGKPFQDFKAGFSFKNYKAIIIRRLLSLGLPAGFQFVFEVGAFGFAVIMIGWLGTKPLASHQIAINLAAISYMMVSGLSAAATIRVGNQLGKKNIHSLKMAATTLFIMSLIFMSFTAILFIVGRHWLPSLYIHDPEVIEIASTLLIIAGFFQLSDGIQVVSLGALRGLSDVKVPTALTFIAYWVLALPSGYFLAFELEMGPRGVWYGLLIGLSLVAVIMITRFYGLVKKLDGKWSGIQPSNP